MALHCDNCGKGKMIGRQHKHHPGVAGGRWKKRAPQTQKIFKPNLHVARIKVNGNTQKMRLCTKCLRLLKGTSKKLKKEVTAPQETPQVVPVQA